MLVPQEIIRRKRDGKTLTKQEIDFFIQGITVDKIFYSVRDVTATVESIPLITASILSKKLAAGLDALVMDVKAGTGAFMPTYHASENLAKSIVGVANGARCKTTALLTNMNQPLASSAGNAVEVREAVQFLTGEYVNPRLHEVTMAAGVEMLVLSGLATDAQQAGEKLQAVLDNAKAAEVFGKMVCALGGPADFIENYDNHLAKSEIIRPVYARQAGIIQAMDTRAIGMAVVNMGGGRRIATDTLDHAVGFRQFAAIGAHVDQYKPLAMVHARTQAQFNEAQAAIQAAIICSADKVASETQVYRRVRLSDI